AMVGCMPYTALRNAFTRPTAAEGLLRQPVRKPALGPPTHYSAIGKRTKTVFARTGISFPKAKEVATMLGSSRTVVIGFVAVLVGIAGLAYMLARLVAPVAAGSPDKRAALVEFTSDGKLKQPVGYRKWVFIGSPLTPNDLNDGEASFPEFHAVYIDPESFAHYEKT